MELDGEQNLSYLSYLSYQSNRRYRRYRRYRMAQWGFDQDSYNNYWRRV